MEFFEILDSILAIINTKFDRVGRRLHMSKEMSAEPVPVVINFIEGTSSAHLSTSELLLLINMQIGPKQIATSTHGFSEQPKEWLSRMIFHFAPEVGVLWYMQ